MVVGGVEPSTCTWSAMNGWKVASKVALGCVGMVDGGVTGTVTGVDGRGTGSPGTVVGTGTGVGGGPDGGWGTTAGSALVAGCGTRARASPELVARSVTSKTNRVPSLLWIPTTCLVEQSYAGAEPAGPFCWGCHCAVVGQA